ncbi:Septin and tuftelin-interacting protein 1 -like protein 2 [Babesia sp. Xinjiang]|uniref:Septin and tuftelin-interacting protein 1 -like protein 2 n=1 Tax=Babesia sp. Xinjiang TaxID=462227 RepID=UPI000A218D48|nr:Septin and tuftelin-interacting protein 1 -like protein 2 [Babesia sp. Xinjiang]ORM39366.1 Septin and tuftelin-interacting protein 1 -like protein 2 [Babesia sp. Xinjiang]
MAPGGGFGSEGASWKDRNRERAIYGIFSAFDSDDSDEGNGRYFDKSRGSNARRRRTKFDDDAPASATSTRFVKGGVLNPDKEKSSEDATSHRSTMHILEFEDEDDIIYMDVDEKEDLDLIDRLLSDNHVKYVKEYDNDSGRGTASSFHKLGGPMKQDTGFQKNLQHRDKPKKGLSYNPDTGLLPQQMNKMYGKGLKMLQKMGYSGGGLGRDGTGLVAPIEMKARAHQRGLQYEGDFSATNRHMVHKEPVRMTGMLVSYSDDWRKKSRSQPSDSGPSRSEHAPGFDILIHELTEKVQCLEKMQLSNMDEVNLAESNVKKLQCDIANMEKNLSDNLALIEQCEKEIVKIVNACEMLDRKLDVLGNSKDDKAYTCALRELYDSLPAYDSGSANYSVLAVHEIVDRYALRCVWKLHSDWDISRDYRLGADIILKSYAMIGSNALSSGIYSHIKQNIMGVLVDYFKNKWNVVDTDQGLQCFEVWNNIMTLVDQPAGTLSNELQSAVITRMLELISTPSRLHLSHIVVHPWLSKFDISKICDLISSFMQAAKEMISIDCLNDSKKCEKVLNAWSDLLERDNMDLLKSHLSTCLTVALKDVSINPRNQDTDVIEKVLLWHEFLGNDRMSDVLCKEFMPRWVMVLRNWLAFPSVNFDEVIVWYTGWKSLFPSTMLKGTGLEKSFKEALRIMDQASREVLNTPSSEDTHAKTAGSPPVTDSLKHRVEELGAEHGLTLIKRGAIQRDGKQLYAFGSATIFFEDDCVMLLKNGVSTSISLDDLIKTAM